VQRQLLLEQADSAGVKLTDDDWQVLRAQHDSALGILSNVLNLSPRILQDSAATPQARVALAMARVDDYFERVVRGRARFFPLPPFLGETLRAHAKWTVDQAGVRRALERAKELRATADSLQPPGPGGAAPGGGMRMPPAPAPTSPDTTSRRRTR